MANLKETLKPKDVDPALLKRLEDKYGPVDMERDFFTDNLETYFKTDEINPETGSVSHKVIKLASFGESLKKMSDAVKALKGLMGTDDGRKDSRIKDIADELKLVFNKYRTHLRKFYPDQYNQIKDTLEEISTSGAAGSYLTPYAFRLKGSKPNDKAYKELGYKEVKENESPSLNAKIYAEDMMRQYRKMYRIVDSNFGSEAADEFKNIVKSKMSQLQEGVGADLGPGPKASEDGVKDNAYVKQFGYKLVPKKIKGSGIIVKQLFEKEDAGDFQKKRIEAFDRIEQEMNDIYKMLSNAKNETSDYYNENPGSYSVVKPTDLVLDYIKDIKDLLKGE